MKRLFIIAILAASTIFTAATYAAAPIESDGNVSIAAGANTVYLDNSTGTHGSYSHIIVWTSSGSSTIYITFNQGATASASNAALYGGAALAFGLPGFSAATNQINYYGSGTAGTLNWVAW